MKRTKFVSTALGLGLVLGTAEARAEGWSVTGFADLNVGAQFGSVRDENALADFEAFGLDPVAKSSQQGFGLAGTDFVVTKDLTDDLLFLTELNLQVARGLSHEIEIDIERMYFEKRINAKFNLRAGMFFTPIGYFNRTLYARAWMMNSAQVPDLFEEELGLVPTHTAGLAANGEFELGAGHRLLYNVSVGNGRGSDPTRNIMARDMDKRPVVTGMLEWAIPGFRDFRLGLSSWYDTISSFTVRQKGESRSTVDPTTEALKLREFGLDAHLVLRAERFSLIAEYVNQRHEDLLGNQSAQDRSTVLHGVFTEFAVNLLSDGRLKPYVRWDYAKLPTGNGPYFGLRENDEGEMTRSFVPDTNLGIVGVAYDIGALQRIKLEYSNALAGVRPQHAVVVQSAFAF